MLFVRHAQSTNNSVQTKVQSKLDGGTNLPEAQVVPARAAREFPGTAGMRWRQVTQVARRSRRLGPARAIGAGEGRPACLISAPRRPQICGLRPVVHAAC